jgi:hypothetical protein
MDAMLTLPMPTPAPPATSKSPPNWPLAALETLRRLALDCPPDRSGRGELARLGLIATGPPEAWDGPIA